MSLLETRNKKFNIPFVFIVGVIFLLGLVYFARYIENYSEKVEVSKSTKANEIHVRISRYEKIYIDAKKVVKEDVAEILKSKSNGVKNVTIRYESHDLLSKTTLEILEILQKGNYDIVVEVSPK